MVWKIDFTWRAEKALSKIDATSAKRILKELHIVSQLDNPRSKGRALKGELIGYWRYRVGDYRVICDIMDSQMLILAINLGHRHDIYER
ncbi:type II toxin-antitoxin system RelE family toxin [Varibaculum vaginae]|uniref:type II toxin-antitoxin system RelE family toxin n=1 Tax=Varibaculum vaginae TaxID=2364797 RepID=UPI000F091991|nr:type II toxin-antitoxin system RelE/ParE family toxin [Varibaculum vaginae]